MTLILIGLLFVCTMGIFLSSQYEKYADYELKSFKEALVDAHYIQVFNIYGADGNMQFSEFLKEKDALERLKAFNKDLHSYYNYFEVYEQPLEYMEFYTKGDRFVCGYEEGAVDELMNQRLIIEKEPIYCTPLKTVEIGENAFRHFSLEKDIDIGETFFDKDSDKVWKTKIMPVLMGSEYKSVYDLGDTFFANYLSLDFQFKVVGFFKEGTYVVQNNKPLYLNRYIALPFMDFNADPQTKDEMLFLADYYEFKNWGFIGIGLSENWEDMRGTFNELCKKYDLLYQAFDLGGEINRSIIDSEWSAMKKGKEVILSISLLLYCTISIIIIILQIRSISLNKKKYAIMMISGADLKSFKFKLLVKTLIVYSISFIGSLAATAALYQYLKIDIAAAITEPIPFVSLLYGVAFLFTAAAEYFYINKCNFAESLKETTT